MKEFFKVVSYQQAQEMVKRRLPGRSSEKVSLQQAYQRVLAENLYSPEALPAFDRSTVDGYAIRSGDSFGSSESIPAFFNLVGEILMGEDSDISLEPAQCAWIPTGGMLPRGADAVVMVEYTEKLGDDTVLVYRPVAGAENVMQTGEDIGEGKLLYPSGQLLRPQDIGLLASLGFSDLKVLRPYRVGIVSTGDEVIPLQHKPSPGQVRDVNSYAIAAAVSSTGNLPMIYPIVEDEYSALKQTVETALAQNDFVILSGGSSVGIKDVTLDVLTSLPDSELLFHGMAIKPGKPTLAVGVMQQLLIGLPGHPVSALMVFHILCTPLLKMGTPGFVLAQSSENIASQPGRDDFIPVQLKQQDNGWLAVPLLGKSGLMSILSRADGYIHIPYEQQGLKKGQKVKAWLF